MIPVRLTIKGFLSYNEPAEIDFTGIHVACITGRNGAGKSAMLDAMTWALFGEARKNDDSVISDLAADQTARVDFQFRYENADYLVSRQKTRGKSTVVDFFIRSDSGNGWKALTEKKGSETNRRICNTLHMDYKTFINVSFFLQGKADQFTGQNATERKKILSSILDLDAWEIYKARAADQRKALESDVQYLGGLIHESEDELKQEDVLSEQEKTVRKQLDEAQKVSGETEERWQQAKVTEGLLKGLETLLKQKQDDENRQSRELRALQEDLKEREKGLNALRAKVADADAVRQRYDQLLQVREQLGKMNAAGAEYNRLRAERSGAEHSIQSTEKQLRYEHDQLLHEKNEIEDQFAEQQRLEQENEKNESELKTLSDDQSRRPELQQQFDAVLDQGNKLRASGDFLDAKIGELSEKIGTLRKNQGALCPTCGRELDAEHCKKHETELRDQISKLQRDKDQNEAVLVSVRKQYAGLQREIKRLDGLTSRVTDLKVRIGTASQKIRSISEKRSAWKAGKEARFAEVARILRDDDFCTAERELLRSTDVRLAELQYDRGKHEELDALHKRLSGAEKAHMDLVRDLGAIEPLESQIREKKAQIQKETEHLQKIRTDREQAEVNYLAQKDTVPDIDSIRKEHEDALDQLHKLSVAWGVVQQQIQHLGEARKNLDRYETEYKEKKTLIERYKTLEKAFGKDGIPALLIEQAVPEIAEEANVLLQKLSNGNMTLQMNTQGTYKSKKDEVKETLEILITDPYGTREYEMFSGGEAFRINFSIRLALSRILAQRAGSRLQTLVIDEGFGSQDDEGRARLADAIRTVQNDFEKILVITHLTELKEEFPSRIEVEKTSKGSRAEVIL